MKKNHDFIVIGGGSGGIAAARRAAEHGAQVLLVESGALGGTCVNVGCVPKKVMWNTSQVHETIGLAASYGFRIDGMEFDWSRIKSSRDGFIRRLNGIYARNLEASGVSVLQGTAILAGPGSILVNGTRYQAEHILIATGGRPSIPGIPGAELGISSDGFFGLSHQPENVLIAGSGYIATELAGLMHGLGSRVTMVLRKDSLLRAFDHEIQACVMSQMEESGIRIRRNVTLNALFEKGGSLGYTNQNAETATGFDCVIWAIGRHPNTAHLNLPSAGVKTDKRGYIETDEYQNTSAGCIYAVGDVTPRAQLTPVAIAAGRRLADRIFNDDPHARLDYSNIPTVIFSHPPVGTVGLSETAASSRFGKDAIRVYRNTFVDMRYGVCEHKPRTMVKLIVHGDDQRIAGCHVVGHSADEMIQGFAVAVKMGATKADLDNTVAIHPTAAEELVTLR